MPKKTKKEATRKNMINYDRGDYRAVGMIEAVGLSCAIEAADAMVKSANVTFEKYAFVGMGLVTVIVRGDIGAVKAAVDAGIERASKIGELASHHIIPNPVSDAELILSDGNNG